MFVMTTSILFGGLDNGININFGPVVGPNRMPYKVPDCTNLSDLIPNEL